MRCASALDEPSTAATNGSLATGVIFFLLYLLLAGFLLKLVLSNLKHVLNTEEHLRPSHLKRYQCLFEDFRCEKKIQMLYVPISLLRSLLLVLIIDFMNFSPVTQIILFWTTNLALLIYKPLKEKWMRIFTSIIEIMIHSCITIRLIIGIVDPFADIDAVTRDEIGFVFLCLSILSTCAGALLSLVQVLELVKSIYEYLKTLRAKKKQVSPIPLPENPIASKELKNLEDKILETNEDGLLRRQTSLPTQKISPGSGDREMFEDLAKLTPEMFEKKQLYGDLKGWWAAFRSEYGSKISDISSDRKSSRPKSRIRLFSGNDP